MKVRILTDVSDRSGVHKAGDEVDLLDERAAEYLKTGIAEEIAPALEHRAAPHNAAPDAAILEHAPEQATLPRARPRGV
jgi:hypothetical protein